MSYQFGFQLLQLPLEIALQPTEGSAWGRRDTEGRIKDLFVMVAAGHEA